MTVVRKKAIIIAVSYQWIVTQIASCPLQPSVVYRRKPKRSRDFALGRFARSFAILIRNGFLQGWLLALTSVHSENEKSCANRAT
jgi:hypothetical protein